MRVIFHIISTGGGGGTSRATRYISERDRDPTREGPGARPLFSEERDDLTYRKADRILDPVEGQPQKDDLIHFSVSFQEEDFDKLGSDEKERQAALRRVVRQGMSGMAAELNVENLTWVAGIHRNTENPHVHIVMRNAAIERGKVSERPIGRLRTNLLPHKQIVDGREVIVPGRIGERFLTALDRQQDRYLSPDPEQIKARDALEELFQSVQKQRTGRDGRSAQVEREDNLTRQFKSSRNQAVRLPTDYPSIAASWHKDSGERRDDGDSAYRMRLGRYLEFSTRLQFAEVWHERAVKHGDTYRFEVVDQSANEERKISELDVHRRAAARAQRQSPIDRATREEAFQADLSRHRTTIDELMAAREAKIAALGKDVGSLRSTVLKVRTSLEERHDTPSHQRATPLLSRETLSALQHTAVRLNLPEKVAELEALRVALAREYKSPTRTDDEAATLVAQVNVARADLMAKDARLENFEAAVHLTPYEVYGERWSLGALDKQIARRREDTKFVPDRAARLDWRSLAHINHSSARRQEASDEVEHLRFVRGEIVRQIKQRREPLIADRDLAKEMVEVLEAAHSREEKTRERLGGISPEPKYERHQINSLEASAETLRDTNLLREVHELERSRTRSDSEMSWEGRAVAREIMSGIAVEETQARLEHFLESRRVASLNLGDLRTGTIREVEARTLTDYVARAIESKEMRQHRHSINLAAREHHGRLVGDFEKAQDYYATARELASEEHGGAPEFTDKEKINLEIYAESQNDPTRKDQFLELARRASSRSQELDVAASRGR